MMATGVVSVQEAATAVDLRVIAFLFSMFVVTTGLPLSGDLNRLTSWIVSHSSTPRRLIILTSFGFGSAAALLMNDTLALMGTPILIAAAKRLDIKAKPLLLTLAFSVTAGSAMTPIGNPQNMLIAVQGGVATPFLSFLYYLLPSTILNLGITAVMVMLVYRKDLGRSLAPFGAPDAAKDSTLSKLSVGALTLAVGGILVVNILSLFGVNTDITISEVALAAATLLLLASSRRNEIMANVDWSVLVMFAGLFVFTKGVYNGGIVGLAMPYLSSLAGIGLLLFIVVSSVILSQVVSNVPLVTLFLPFYAQVIPPAMPVYWAAFAGASTLAGNVTLLGAASNLIIVEQAEKAGERIGFTEFALIGIPLSVACLGVLFGTLLPHTL